MRCAYVGFPTLQADEKVSRTNKLPHQLGLGVDEASKKERNRIPVSSFVSTGKVIEGNLTCLTCLFGRNRRPSPHCLRLQPLRGKLHQTSSWLNRSPLAANQRCTLCSRGIGNDGPGRGTTAHGMWDKRVVPDDD